MGMYVRDTALKFKQRGIDLTKQTLGNMSVNRTPYQGGYGGGYGQQVKNPYSIDDDKGNKEDIRWLL